MSQDQLRPEGELDYRLADKFQRHGLTLTEIALTMNVDREVVVAALYTERVQDLVFPEPEFVPERLMYAGA
jgi:hypothetical protein